MARPFCGGTSEPVFNLLIFFVFHAAIAAVALESRPARRVAAAIGGFVLVLAAVEASFLPPHCLLSAGQSTCAAAFDGMRHTASAVAVAVAVFGCAYLLSSLVNALRDEHVRLAAAEDDAREERERLQMILDCMADAVLYVTPDGYVRVRNRAAWVFWPAESLSKQDCKKIVRDLLEYARQRPPERRPVGLRGLLSDVVRTLEPQAQTSNVTIHHECDVDRDVVIPGDPDQLRQTLVNLGLNAIEAMPNGGLLRFKLSSSPDGTVQIAVVDTGVGIPLEEQDRIFTAFHTTKPQGTGLGLTVARDLVTAQGGTIELRSTRDRGSTFTITFPGADLAILAEADL